MYPGYGREDFGLSFYLAREALKGISAESREAYGQLAFAVLEVWKREAGEVSAEGHGSGLLFPQPSKTRRLTADEMQRIPAWECCGSWSSPVGLLYHLWLSGYKPLKKTLDGSKGKGDLLKRMLATLILQARIPEDYFDVRLASDYLTVSALAKLQSRPINLRRKMANLANAKRPRKAIAVTTETLNADREKYVKRYGSARGWLSKAAIEFDLSHATVARRWKKQS